MKLEPKHLILYLPYELEIINGQRGFIGELLGIQSDLDILHKEGKTPIRFIKPILKLLSDYDDVNGEAMNDLNCDVSDQITINEFATGYIDIGQVDYQTILIMAINHIDMFKLIPNDLAIDINTLK